ncbi:MAG TPA: hypothetical protein VHP37_08990 [Burkholderiales bacterium]|nr:hypothetical protein [Burkholderiales bacterium]
MRLARCACATLVALAVTSFVAGASQPKENRAMSNPSASRPAPPEVPGIDHKGVHYEQDLQSSTLGGQLAAYDQKTGARLWTLRIYDVKDHSAAAVPNPGIYFRSMKVLPGRDELAIENEVGGRYTVDLAKRTVTTVFEPTAKPKAHKKLPTPPG